MPTAAGGGGGGGGEGGSDLGPDGLGRAATWSASSASSWLRRRLRVPPRLFLQHEGAWGHQPQAWWWWMPSPPEAVGPSFVARLLDFAICHLIPGGEEWLPVKTEPDFGHGGRWRRLRVATLLKASSMQPSPHPGYSGGSPRSGSPGSDDGDARRCYPLEGIVFRVDAA
jgi:hypothetical protein